MTQLHLVSNGKADPGAMGHDALIMRDGKPIAGIRDAEMVQGIIYGAPVFRHWGHREMFAHQFRLNRTIELEIRHRRFGNVHGNFRIVSCEDGELSLKRVD